MGSGPLQSEAGDNLPARGAPAQAHRDHRDRAVGAGFASGAIAVSMRAGPERGLAGVGTIPTFHLRADRESGPACGPGPAGKRERREGKASRRSVASLPFVQAALA